MSREEREYVLRKQLKAIQEELNGQGDPSEAGSLRDKLAKAELPVEVRKEVDRELIRLERMPAASPDDSVTRTYVEFLLDLSVTKKLDTNTVPRGNQFIHLA